MDYWTGISGIEQLIEWLRVYIQDGSAGGHNGAWAMGTESLQRCLYSTENKTWTKCEAK